MTSFANRWSTKALSTLLCAFLLCPSLTSCTAMAPALAQSPTQSAQPAQPAGAPVTDPWPRQLASGDDTFSVFQPQYERWQGNRLEGRAAVAVESQASAQPKYGVMWFAARSQVDKETRMVALEDLTVSKINFPTVPDGGAAYLTALRQTLTIPASSPLHYVTYAYVYGSTPEVVYTGYTPGYMGTVVAPGPTVVYGTGYVYPGWVGSFWYPAPVTWGWGPFALGFGVGVFTGFAFGFGVGAWGGWYGGWGWHGGCCWGWHGGIGNVNVYNHWGNNVNVTKNTTNIGHIGNTTRISGGHGNVYAGHDGNAYRRDGNGRWQGHNASGGWDSARGSTAEHEQAHQVRQQGQQRVNGYNRQANAHGVARSYHGGGGFHGGGGSHGGGGRR